MDHPLYAASRRSLLFCFALSGLLGITAIAQAQNFIVKDGQAQAQIVISESPQRATLLAAKELQMHVEKITGARLAIVTTPGQLPVQIFVGQSPYTDKLGLKIEGLDHGSYRVLSGDHWLALIGQDTNYIPTEPWARNRRQRTTDRGEPLWDKISGGLWGWPHTSAFKYYLGNPNRFDADQPLDINSDKPVELWQYDERGSYNAVCHFLRTLGVRWYMPGDIGLVLPDTDTIALPKIDVTEHPDIPVRQFNERYGVADRQTSEWFMRLGTRHEPRMEIAHGLRNMTGRDEYKQAHPDHFALYGQVRATERNQLCLSSPGLFDQAVRYVRALMDHAGIDEVSLMPNDAFIAICQCPLCEGKDTPQRGRSGLMSDYVWGFVNDVAREVGKTHPDKKIICLAYGTYRLPPAAIDKLEPNVRVGIVNGRGPREANPKDIGKLSDIYQAWIPKTDNRILDFENYVFTRRGWYLPFFSPITIVKGFDATAPYSIGEDIWLSIGREFYEPGYNHLNVYFTARAWWGGQNDAQAMFEEYCSLFYGPAAAPMQAFLEYCEANWQGMDKDADKIDQAVALFDKAIKAAPDQSIYSQRIALIDKYLQTLRNRKEQILKEKDRSGVPSIFLARRAQNIKIDGVLDEHAWTQSAGWGKGKLSDLLTGKRPHHATSFRVAWEGNDMYFGIRCEDSDMANIPITAQKHDDPSLWYGDTVEILIETDKESYYQIAINPAGAVVDIYRTGAKGKVNLDWDAEAQVATTRDEHGWTVEIRLPVLESSEDPLHQVIGSKPMKSLPWYFNVCRSRVRGDDVQLSAFSPTGEKSFHVPHKFAQLTSK